MGRADSDTGPVVTGAVGDEGGRYLAGQAERGHRIGTLPRPRH